jgi:inositol-hexakisphosphate/diphosphoinositol-pentakisphosphate 1-kinase
LEEAENSQLASPEFEKEEPAPGVDRQSTSTTLSPNERNSFAQKIGFRRRSVLTPAPATPPLASDSGDSQYFKLYQGNSEKREKLDSRLSRLKELYRLSQVLFKFLGPLEYGITGDQKLEIGLLTSLPFVLHAKVGRHLADFSLGC